MTICCTFCKIKSSFGVAIRGRICIQKVERNAKKNITLKQQMMSKMVYHVLVKGNADNVSMLMIILPTKINTTVTTTPMMVRKTKRMDHNLLLKALTLSVWKRIQVFIYSACRSTPLHYTNASVAGHNASDTTKCDDLISFPKVKNGRTEDTTHIGRLSKFDLEKGTPYSNKQTTRRCLMPKSPRWVTWEGNVLKERTHCGGRSFSRRTSMSHNADVYLESAIVFGGVKKKHSE